MRRSVYLITLCLVLGFHGLAAGVGLPAGTSIQLVATADYTDALARVYSSLPASVTLTVIQVAGVNVEFTQPAQPATPGQVSYIPFRVINTGNGFDAINLTAVSSHGWPVAIVYDNNVDGIHQSTENTVITGTGSVIADGWCCAFVRLSVPSGATTGDDITVIATSGFNPAQGRAAADVQVPTPDKTATSVSAQVSPSAPSAQQTVTVTGTILPAGQYTLTATVTSPTGTATPQSITTQANGSYSFQFTPATYGNWQANVTYAGDATHGACSTGLTVAVTKIATSLALTSSPASPDVGASVTINGMLTPAQQAPIIITRTDPDGATSQATVNSSASGAFTWNTSFNKAGAWRVTAFYAGNSTYAAFSKDLAVTVVDPKAEADTVTITAGPSITPSEVTSAGTTQCNITATDSKSHTLTYQWSDGGAGGSFSPSAAVRNPVYTSKSNISGQNVSVTLTCTATCSQSAQSKATGAVVLTVHSINISSAGVVSVVPGDGEQCVDLMSPIVITFDRAMNRQATEQAITVPPGLLLPQYTWTADSRILTITHQGFLPGTTYTGVVGTGARDASGNAISAEYSWSFDTTTALAFASDEVTSDPGATFATPAISLNDPSLPDFVTFFVGVPNDLTLDPTLSGGSLACVQPGSGVGMFFSEWDPQNREIAVTASVPTPAVGVEIVKSITLRAPSGSGARQITLDNCPALTVRYGSGLPGDFNSDGAISITDASMFIQQWQRWHRSPKPAFDPRVDGRYDLAPRTTGTWPNWAALGDQVVDIKDASAFIECWITSRYLSGTSQAASCASLTMGDRVERPAAKNAITVSVNDAPGGQFQTSVTIPADAEFDPTVDNSGNLLNVSQGRDVSGLFFTEYDAATRTVLLAGSVTGRAPYKVATIYLTR